MGVTVSSYNIYDFADYMQKIFVDVMLYGSILIFPIDPVVLTVHSWV